LIAIVKSSAEFGDHLSECQGGCNHPIESMMMRSPSQALNLAISDQVHK
jgi:hypothetical protein